MHFLVPRAAFLRNEEGEIEVKSLNIASPTREARALLNTYRDFINETYGLASPTDSARARLVRLSEPTRRIPFQQACMAPTGNSLLASIHQRLAMARDAGEKFHGPTRLRDDLRLLIAHSIRQEFDEGRIRNRDDVVAFLEREGLKITRLRRDSLTVEIPGFQDYFPAAQKQDGRVRLQGILFCETFDVAHVTQKEKSPLPASDKPQNPETAQTLMDRLEVLKERRATYHQSRYRLSSTSDKPHSGESLPSYLDRTLGNEAMSQSQKALHIRQRQTRKRRRKRRYRDVRQVIWHETIWSQEAHCGRRL